MHYKDDWEQSKQRLTAFWNQEIIDRSALSEDKQRLPVSREDR